MGSQDSDGGARFPLRALRAASGLVLTAIVVITLGALLHAARNPTHTARSQLLLRPALPAAALRPLETSRATDVVPGLDLSAETEGAILTSPLIASRVAQALRLGTPAERLSRAVTATPVTDTLIEVQASVDDPRLAARLANGFADQYLAYRRESTAHIVAGLQHNLGKHASRLWARIDRLNGRIAALEAVGAPTGTAVRTQQSLVAQRDDLVATVTVLQTRAIELRALATLPSAGGDVIQRAPPARGSGPLPAGALGIVLGGTLGAVVALLRAVVEPFAGATKAVGGLPALVTIPQISRHGEPTLLREPGSAAASSYRLLRSALLARGLGASRRRVLVVPAESGQRASAVVANLAVACAQAGLRTVVVAADAGRAGAPAMLGSEARHGRDAALEGDVRWLGRLVATGTVNLLVLPAASNTAELLAILDEAARLFDVILIDAPPVRAGDQTVTLAERCELALLVAPAAPAQPAAVGDAAQALEQASQLMTGLVLVSASTSGAGGRSTAASAVDRPHRAEPRGWAGRQWWYVPVVLAGIGSAWGGPGIAVLAILGVVGLLAVLRIRAWAWAAAALGLTALIFVLNRASVVPDMLTFAHFPVVYLGLAAVLFRNGGRWPPVARRLALAIAGLFLAACMSAVLHHTEALRPLVTIGIWAEPFVLVLLLLLEPPSERERIALLALFGALVVLQLPFAVEQAVTLGVGDTVKGTLNSAHDMAAFTVLGSLALLTWASERSPATGLACLLAALPFLLLVPVLADAKQVIFALPAAAMVLFLTTRRLSWRLVIAAALTGTLAVLLTLIPAGKVAVESINDAVGGKSGKAVGFDVVVDAMRSEWVYAVFGLGPANGLSRTAFLTADNHALRSTAPLRRFHLRPAPVYEQARAQAAVLASAKSKDTSFNLPISSMLGIFSDLGVIGLLAFGLLMFATMAPLVAMRRYWLARAALAGWTMSIPLAFTFDWWEQPPFMIQLALLAGLAISAGLPSRGPEQETVSRTRAG